jgi:hypothetical protein
MEALAELKSETAAEVILGIILYTKHPQSELATVIMHVGEESTRGLEVAHLHVENDVCQSSIISIDMTLLTYIYPYCQNHRYNELYA